MSEHDDLSRALPDAPPPRPAQRRAALESAMARFDGYGAARPLRARPPRAASRWRWPQLSALATAALVGVVSVSLWKSGEYREGPLPRSPASPAAKAVAPSRPPEQVLRDSVPTAPAAAPSKPIAAAAPPAVDNRGSEAPSPPAPAAEPALPAPRAAYAAAPPPPPAPPPARAQSAARANVDAVLAEDIGAFPEAGDIVITGARTGSPARARARPNDPMLKAHAPAMRGDWNACTIDDPARSLAACREMIDPGTPGGQGSADAQIAEGLNRAWAGDMRGAAAAFDRAVGLSGKSSLAYLNRGLARERSGDRRGALADLDKAVRLSPRSARAHYHRSLLRERSGATSGARADARRALALDPTYQAVIR